MSYYNDREMIYSRTAENPATGCYEWQGAVTKSTGYGKVSYAGKSVDTHRALWTMVHGPIAPGLHVCHKCDNRKCVRESHLFLGTPSENMIDARDKGRLATPNLRGEAHPAAVYPASTIEAIYRMAHDEGMTDTEVALLMGVSRGHVWNIKTGRKWAHLTAELNGPAA